MSGDDACGRKKKTETGTKMIMYPITIRHDPEVMPH
jgi:hypothetical protein